MAGGTILRANDIEDFHAGRHHVGVEFAITVEAIASIGIHQTPVGELPQSSEVGIIANVARQDGSIGQFAVSEVGRREHIVVVVKELDEIILLRVKGDAAAASKDVVKVNLALLSLGVSTDIAASGELAQNLVHHALALVAQVGSVLAEEDTILG